MRLTPLTPGVLGSSPPLPTALKVRLRMVALAARAAALSGRSGGTRHGASSGALPAGLGGGGLEGLPAPGGAGGGFGGLRLGGCRCGCRDGGFLLGAAVHGAGAHARAHAKASTMHVPQHADVHAPAVFRVLLLPVIPCLSPISLACFLYTCCKRPSHQQATTAAIHFCEHQTADMISLPRIYKIDAIYVRYQRIYLAPSQLLLAS